MSTKKTVPVKKFIVTPGVFPYSVAFWVGRFDLPEVVKFLRRNGLYDEEAAIDIPQKNCLASCYNLYGASMIWLESAPERIVGLGFLVHECLHATIDAGNYLGFRLSNKSDEFYTYFQQCLVEQSLSRFL